MRNIEIVELTALRLSIANATNLKINESQMQAYEMYLSLIKHYPWLKAVPTKRIDKVWHYHISQSELYFEDCSRIVGHLISHKVVKKATDKNRLRENYNLTNQLWQISFNVPMGSDLEMAACGVDGDDGVSGPDE